MERIMIQGASFHLFPPIIRIIKYTSIFTALFTSTVYFPVLIRIIRLNNYWSLNTLHCIFKAQLWLSISSNLPWTIIRLMLERNINGSNKWLCEVVAKYSICQSVQWSFWMYVLYSALSSCKSMNGNEWKWMECICLSFAIST